MPPAPMRYVSWRIPAILPEASRTDSEISPTEGEARFMSSGARSEKMTASTR